MGHRKRHAAHRGSLAFRPRGRASRVVPRIRTWPQLEGGKPALLGLAGFKVGMLHVITADDREKMPNFGKPLFNASTALTIPRAMICGLRAYSRNRGALQALSEAYIENLPKDLDRKVRIKPQPLKQALKDIEGHLPEVQRFTALACILPKGSAHPQKKPFILELGVGGEPKAQFEHLKSILGKELRASDIIKPGMYVDVAAISKGKGFEGPITRFGVKRKQSKSRKSVRAVAVLGPWHPASVMYTVPRAGQMGFHQRVEYNKRVIAMGDATGSPLSPKGGFPHFGQVKGEYVILRGSIPGPPKRLVVIRLPVRPPRGKVQAPRILEAGLPQLVR